MSFKSYAIRSTDYDLITLDDPQPLMFSGRNGLIAKFVLSEKNRAMNPWKLCVGEIHAIAFPAKLLHDRAIVFEQAEDSERTLMWLQSISGISNSKTEMMFSFTPLAVVNQNLLTVRRSAVDRSYGEDLMLDGGVLSPEGPWHWKKPHLALGGVVLGSSTLTPLASTGFADSL
ncbi:MAG: hypothetical protein IPP19_12845 [Verrucomicrobia bacterium]|nr:hypothetical protein [Verrucomicrobiota bacterium]